MADQCCAGAGFWTWHLVLPLVAAISMLTLLEHTNIDLFVADRWYAQEGNEWAWRSSWLAYDLIHHHGKQLIITIGLAVITLAILSFRIQKLRPWRQPLFYLLLCMSLLPALIAFSKRFSQVPCPWDLERYGGDLVYQRTFDYALGASDIGHCFPAGHASGGFALLALYFAALPFARRPALFLLPGLVIGTIFALGQQARGAHFVSHDLWSLSLVWFGALGIFLLFKPQRWGMIAS